MIYIGINASNGFITKFKQFQDTTVSMVEMCLWTLIDSDNDNDGDDKNIVGPNQWKGVGSALG